MLDLYGRGWSGSPTVAHSSSIYMTQILSVLASSKSSWTGVNAFSLIGYSMGGALAANFTALFPLPVKSLVLIAPAGLLREKRLARQKQVMAVLQTMPKPLVRHLVRKLADKQKPTGDEEVTGSEGGPSDKVTVHRVYRSMKWQIDNNEAFIDAFISSVLHAPLGGQHKSWISIRDRLEAMKKQPAGANNSRVQEEGLVGGKVVVFLAEGDTQIVREEVEPDIKESLGHDNVELVVFDGGHELPVARPVEVADELWNLWSAERLGVTGPPTTASLSDPPNPVRAGSAMLTPSRFAKWPARTDSLHQ
jgi:pimeloyl-ACP methyl ester carboxylesterase